MAMASLHCFTALPPLSSSFSPLSHSTTLNSLPLFSSSTTSPTSTVFTSSHPLFPAANGRCRWRGCQASSQDGNFSVGEALDERREPMVPPYNVLITGSTKGIGFALAKEFLNAGDNVVICSRSAERLESAVQNLRQEFGDLQVWGTVCDVREGKDVKALVSYAREKLNYIDIWINNAGSNAYSYKPLAEASDEDLMEVVSTNTLGLMICCREAIKMMLHQPRGGHVFNMDGAGSDGRPTPRFAAYGATKRSVVHLTKSLQAELRMQEVKNVMVHNLSPGMVTTDLLMSGAKTKQAKFFINVLAEPAEVVANYIVPSVRSVVNNGSMRPTYIRFLTGLKRLAFGARRNRYMIED